MVHGNVNTQFAMRGWSICIEHLYLHGPSFMDHLTFTFEDQRIPPISPRIGLISTPRIAADTSVTAATSPNSVGRGSVLKNPAAQPASLFPTAFDKNHSPIVRPTIRAGASFVTTLSPTGLSASSPI